MIGSNVPAAPTPIPNNPLEALPALSPFARKGEEYRHPLRGDVANVMTALGHISDEMLALKVAIGSLMLKTLKMEQEHEYNPKGAA